MRVSVTFETLSWSLFWVKLIVFCSHFGSVAYSSASFQQRLQWGRSNLAAPPEWRNIGLPKPEFGSIMLGIFLGKTAKHSPRNLLNLIFREWPQSDEFWQGFGSHPGTPVLDRQKIESYVPLLLGNIEVAGMAFVGSFGLKLAVLGCKSFT